MFAGVSRNSLSFEDIQHLASGGSIERSDIVRFHKSIQTLDIKIRETSLTVKASADKPLIGNKYIPLHIDLVNTPSSSSDVEMLMKTQVTGYNKAIRLYSSSTATDV